MRLRRRSLLAVGVAAVAPALLLGSHESRRPATGTTELALLHTGDGKGVTEPCSCKGALGGLARRASAVAGLRRGTDALLLEAGNVLTAGYDPKHGSDDESALMLAAMQAMRYDAMAIGVGDAANGLGWLRQWQAEAAFSLLSANLVAAGELVVPPSATFERGGITVAVLGLTAAPTDALPDGLTVSDPVSAAQAYLPGLGGQADVVVVVGALGPEVEARLLAQASRVDALLGGGTAEPCPEASQAPLPAHTSAGPNGEHLGVTTLTLDDAGRARAYSFRPVPLDATFADDPGIASLLHRRR